MPFDSSMQAWEEYCKILDHFFVANGNEDGDKKRAVLLSCLGVQTDEEFVEPRSTR